MFEVAHRRSDSNRLHVGPAPPVVTVRSGRRISNHVVEFDAVQSSSRRVHRVLIVMPPGDDRDAITRIFEASELFDIVGTVTSGGEMRSRVGWMRPDIVVLDERLPRVHAAKLARRLVLERPLAVALVSDGEEEPGERSLRMVRFPRRLLQGENSVARRAARTRLALLAARVAEPRQTAPNDEIVELTDAIRAETEREQPASPVALELARIPLDLIAVVLEDRGLDAFAEALSRVPSVRVPTLVALLGDPRGMDALEDAAYERRLEIGRLSQTAYLRRWQGIRVASRDDGVVLDGDVVRVTAGASLNVDELLGSIARIEKRALAIAMSPVARSVYAAVGRVSFAGGHAIVGTSDEATGTLPVRTLQTGDIAWLLRNATPRRI